MKDTFSKINKYLLAGTVFILPFFFLPITQEFFTTNKLYLLTVISLILLTLSVIKFSLKQTITWNKTPFDTPFFLLLLTIVLSVVISSPNKIQALLNQNFGFVLILFLTIFYYYLVQNKISPLKIASTSALLLSIVTIFFFFNPLKNVELPQILLVLKNPQFTPLGNGLDLGLFLGFFLVLQLVEIVKQKNTDKSLPSLFSQILSVAKVLLILIALILSVYTVLKPSPAVNQNQQLPNIVLPPMRLSWYAAVEVLKNPVSALFGVGVDNYPSIFTRVKDVAYNVSNLWQVNSFSVGRSAILHIFSETGIFGLIALGILLLTAVRNLGFSNDQDSFLLRTAFGYLLFWLVFFPPSLPLFFLLFLTLAVIAKHSLSEVNYFSLEITGQLFDFILVIISMIFILAGGYFLGRSYLAEIYFKKSLDAYFQNNFVKLYQNQRQAILLNNYIERYRLNFSQVNFLIAKDLLTNKKKDEITDDDKKKITEAIQASIAEAKAAITLNPQKANNWANLAEIYRNIVNVVQGSDVWTVSAYQRAIIADPQNPAYRFSLGQFYYALGNYTEAIRFFEQAAAMKPDFTNAYYNLAWAAYQKKDYVRAVSEMQNALNTLDPKQAKNDYEKAKKDLEEFKKSLPEVNQNNLTEQNQTNPSQLRLPIPPNATFSPRIKLPQEQEASPEAR